jgi:hypothetical protein
MCGQNTGAALVASASKRKGESGKQKIERMWQRTKKAGKTRTSKLNADAMLSIQNRKGRMQKNATGEIKKVLANATLKPETVGL